MKKEGKDMEEKLRKKYCPMTETIFYTLLALLEPNHGYGIMKFVRELTQERVKMGTGTLYTMLGRLVEDQMILVVNEEDGKKTVDVLKSLGMIRFAGAVMYVLKNVFGMEERFMLVPANEREGKFLLDEIMLAGNFGHHDPRVGYGRKSSAWNLFWRRVSRSSRFIFRYPSEAIWTPFFKMVNFFYWRRKWSLLA